MRQIIMQRCYKRSEDFDTEEEYDTYLERIENLSNSEVNYFSISI